MSRQWHVYRVMPIDFGWFLAPTVKEFYEKLVNVSDDSMKIDNGCYDLRDFLNDWEEAQKRAADLGWEGDFREEPRVMILPDETQFSYAFIIKQEHRGSTYVVTPEEMPWLNEISG
jgi:hypothetical protein